VKLSSSILYTFLTQIPIQVFGIISGVFIARMIGPEGKGVFALYQANAQLIAVFFSLSFGSALTYFVPSGTIAKNKILAISLYIIIACSILIFLLLLFLNYSNYKELLFPEKYSGVLYLVWLYLFSILSIIGGIATGFFQGMKKFNKLNKILLYNSILNILSFGVLFFIHKSNLFEINTIILLYCMLFISLINIFQFIYYFYKDINIKPSFNVSYSKDLKPMIEFTLYTHLSLFVGFFNARLSLWFLNYYLDEVAIGLFSLATNLIVIFNMISAPIGNVLMPFLSGENIREKEKMFYKYSKINFTSLILLAVFSFLIANWIIPLIYGADFRSAALLFQILLPGIIFSNVSRLYAVYIASCNKQIYNLYATILSFIVNIVFNFILIKYFGLIGASLSSTFTYFASFLTMAYFVHIKLKMPFGNYYFMNYHDIKTVSSYLKSFIKTKS